MHKYKKKMQLRATTRFRYDFFLRSSLYIFNFVYFYLHASKFHSRFCMKFSSLFIFSYAFSSEAFKSNDNFFFSRFYSHDTCHLHQHQHQHQFIVSWNKLFPVFFLIMKRILYLQTNDGYFF